MDFKIVEIFNRSVTIELDSDAVFKQTAEFGVYVDGIERLRTDRNVISVMGLLPDKKYKIGVDAGGELVEKEIVTEHESVLLDVRKFGAVGDGVTSDTAAIQAAICACPKDGTVYLPAGKYFTTPIFLKSDMTFWLDEGAVLLGETDRNKIPVLPGMTMSTDEADEYNLGSWEGNPLDNFASLVTAIDAQNLDIIGPGVIDGNAQNSDW